MGEPIRRALRVLEAEGVAGLAMRVKQRIGGRFRRRRPPTLPSPIAVRIQRLSEPRPSLHVFHLGKTGGTALKHALGECLETSRYHLWLHGHDVTLEHVPRGERFMFILRDPVTRFTSAFNSRLSEGLPRYHYPWTEAEREAFTTFRRPEDLAEALSAPDERRRDQARRAMSSIGHVNQPYSFWFGSESDFRRRLSDVFFIAFQDRLDEDFELLKLRLGLPEQARLPSDPVVAHRSPHRAELSERARANLERWYDDDVQLVEFFRQLAPIINTEGIVSPRVARTDARPAVRRSSTSSVRSRSGRQWARVAIPLVAGVLAFIATGLGVEATTDRDWSLSGLEWPADLLTTVFLVCLVPLVYRAVDALLEIRKSTRSGKETKALRSGSKNGPG